MNDTPENDQRSSKRSRPGIARKLAGLFGSKAGRRSSPRAEVLALPPLSRSMLSFSLVLFFVFGMVVAGIVLMNPFGFSWLPGQEGPATRTAPPEMPPPEPDQLYQCPMHPEVIEREPGTCPVCQMRLMPVDRGPASEDRTTAGAGKRKVLYWYAPMDPTYIRDEPGTSPMGMKLVPKYADESTADSSGVIRIDPVQIQNIGVVSHPASKGPISRTVRTLGILDFNADRITWVNTKYSGWIEKVHVNYVGQEVRRNQPLFEIYSPELVTTQEEYLRALEYRASLEASERVEARRQAESLVNSTRDRLRYWDISEDQIEDLENARTVRRRLTVRAPVDGVVAEVMDQALEGMRVQAGMNLYKIADLSTLWVHADVYESDLPWIRENQPAEVSFRSDPDHIFRGKILFLYPEVSKETRTLKICVEVPNSKNRLRAGMYTDVVLHGPPIRDAVLISNSAVLRSGERNIVFVDLGEGRFEPREVELGVRGQGDLVQIVKGVAAGESVVVQAQFMLDSESRVQEAIAKFLRRSVNKPKASGEQPAPSGHRHGG